MPGTCRGEGRAVIISHEYRFIFVKTKKTAGTSIEIALSEFCGDRDIITPLIPKEDERIRSHLGFRGPQNYLIPFRKYSLADWARLFLRRKRKSFYSHIGAQTIRGLVDEEVWGTYFKFCFERNPWDKVVSAYYHFTHKSAQRPTISEFIQSGTGNTVGGNGGFDLYTVSGEIVVDRVCLYENLDQEIGAVMDRLGLPGKLRLPHAKSEYRIDRRHYRELLSEEDRVKISRVFAREIAYFGYTY